MSEARQQHNQQKSSLLKMNTNLENGYKMVLESEETGRTILSDLFSQRETMERARDRLRETNMNLGKSSRVVSAMTRHLVKNKLILIGMCVLLALFLIFVVYMLVRKSQSN